MGSDFDRTVSAGTYLEPEDNLLYAKDARRLRSHLSSPEKSRSQRMSERLNGVIGAAMYSDHFETHVQQQLLHRNQQNEEAVMETVARRWGDDVRNKSSLKQIVKRVEQEQSEWVNDPNAVYQSAPESSSDDEDVLQAPWHRIIGSTRDHKMLKERVGQAKQKQERQKRKSWGGGMGSSSSTRGGRKTELTSASAPGSRHHSAHRHHDDAVRDTEPPAACTQQPPAAPALPDNPPASPADQSKPASPEPRLEGVSEPAAPEPEPGPALEKMESSAGKAAAADTASADPTAAAPAVAVKEDEAKEGGEAGGEGSEDEGSEDDEDEYSDDDEEESEEGDEEGESVSGAGGKGQSAEQGAASPSKAQQACSSAQVVRQQLQQQQQYQRQQQQPQRLQQQAAGLPHVAALGPTSLDSTRPPATSAPLPQLLPSPPSAFPSHPSYPFRPSGPPLHISPTSSSDQLTPPFQPKPLPSRLNATTGARRVNFPPPLDLDPRLKALGTAAAMRRKCMQQDPGDLPSPPLLSTRPLSCRDRSSSARMSKKTLSDADLATGDGQDSPQACSPGALPQLHAPFGDSPGHLLFLNRRSSCPGHEPALGPGSGSGSSPTAESQAAGPLCISTRRHAAMLPPGRAAAAAAAAAGGAGGGGAVATATSPTVAQSTAFCQTRSRRGVGLAPAPTAMQQAAANSNARMRTTALPSAFRTSEPGSLLASYVLRPRAAGNAATAANGAGEAAAPTSTDKYQLPVLQSGLRVPRISVG